ncbi:hypothetical protein IMX26_00295 [Clostridium sp. 'deep sea']|uniref:hypothetical protein n=1 Tax=Clostridium sp. 'deep sea' TaxID=2779445 RepID=UPI001896A504|nr:hypothetical protein [Clostridium sp. 'deep sea']QOR35316.1 hypothetical protein IMX26_00295 [Clostridium sp. 'deep sea']
MSYFKNDKQFINKICQKINVLNYEKQEEEIVKRNNRNFFKQCLYNSICLIILPLIFSLVIYLKYGLDQFLSMIIGAMLLCSGVIYENNSGEQYYGNKHK